MRAVLLAGVVATLLAASAQRAFAEDERPATPAAAAAAEEAEEEQTRKDSVAPPDAVLPLEARPEYKAPHHIPRTRPALESEPWGAGARTGAAPQYVPPQRASLRAETMGGGTRGSKGDATGAPAVIALAPSDHVGRTHRAQPVLYWYAAEDLVGTVDVVVFDMVAAKRVLHLEPDDAAAGIHEIRLEDAGVSLQRDTEYRWWVSHDEAGTGSVGISRVASDAALREEFEAAPERRAHVLARHGLWYDALEAAMGEIARRPDDPASSGDRDALLAQVGVSVR